MHARVCFPPSHRIPGVLRALHTAAATSFTTIDWRFADVEPTKAAPSLTSIRSNAGVALASLTNLTSSVLSVFGYMAQREAMAPARPGTLRVQCSHNGLTWVDADRMVVIPGSYADHTPTDQFVQHFKAQLKSASTLNYELNGVRFLCPFSAETSVVPGMPVSVRLGVDDQTRWRIDGITVRCPGYPLLPSGNGTDCLTNGNSSAVMHSRTAWNGSGHAVTASASSVALTACLPLVIGVGYDVRSFAEYIVWYTMLGARRVVIFESIEPEVEMRLGAQRASSAQRNRDALYALATSLGPERLHIVRGLAAWQMMRRTLNHNFGQTLASNICRAGARSLPVPDEGGSRLPSYVTQMDVDEFLVPPLDRPDIGGLEGALSDLAWRLHTSSTTPVTAHYLNGSDTALSSRRLEPIAEGAGSGRCLVFANVYYLPSQCKRTMDERPAILRYDSRIHSDRFEVGVSYAWSSMKSWNWLHRSKYLTSADDDTLTGVHECCCTRTSNTGACQRQGGWGMPARVRNLPGIAPCSAVEHIPAEFWEVRHVKYGLAPSSLPAPSKKPSRRESHTHQKQWCETHPNGILVYNITADSKHGVKEMVKGSLERRNAIPTAWAEALQRGVADVLQSVKKGRQDSATAVQAEPMATQAVPAPSRVSKEGLYGNVRDEATCSLLKDLVKRKACMKVLLCRSNNPEVRRTMKCDREKYDGKAP